MKNAENMIFAYEPLKDQEYMSKRMQAYFKKKLYCELQDLLEKEPEFSATIQEDSTKESDFADQGTNEELRFNHFVCHEHDVHHRQAIEVALRRIEDGSYGYCAATGRPIGIHRMLAAPYATYCIDVQSERENGYRKMSSYRAYQ